MACPPLAFLNALITFGRSLLETTLLLQHFLQEATSRIAKPRGGQMGVRHGRTKHCYRPRCLYGPDEKEMGLATHQIEEGHSKQHFRHRSKRASIGLARLL